MKTNTSIVKNLGAAALVFTLSNNGASAAEVDAQVESVSAAVQQALAGSEAENMSESQIQNMIHESIESLVSIPTSFKIDETQNHNHGMTAELLEVMRSQIWHFVLFLVHKYAQAVINIANKNYKFTMILSIFNAILTIFIINWLGCVFLSLF